MFTKNNTPPLAPATLPLIAIVGPTASGKTSLAIRLARQYGGEIICADSRTIYKGMDIGTAKPTPHEQALVPHWGLDLVEPGQRFTVVDFQRYANRQIAAIRQRGRIPFLVGGTGLYVDAVLYKFQFPTVNKKLMQQLQGYSIETLHEHCRVHNIELPNNKYNKRHVINTIVREGQQLQRSEHVDKNTYVVGIATPRDVLRRRIAERTEQLFAHGVVQEATELAAYYGWESEAMTGNIYPIIHKLQQGEYTLEQAKAAFCTADWRLAKRQMTWLRRNPDIIWCGLEDAETYLGEVLAQARQM